jgi:two-component system OmpR family response regulator
MRILLVEDDQILARQLQRGLAVDGTTVIHAPTVAEGQLLAQVDTFTALILDLQMPDGTGVEVLRLVRAQDHAVPVLVFSAIDREDVIIRVLDAGADDYVVKPVSLNLLQARLRALVRRGTAATAGVTRIGGLVVDVGRRQAWLDGRPLPLSALELSLLAYLAAHAETPQSRETLLRDVWGQQSHQGGNVVEVTVMRLRQRLGRGPTTPVIDTVRGVGYVLRPPTAEG